MNIDFLVLDWFGPSFPSRRDFYSFENRANKTMEENLKGWWCLFIFPAQQSPNCVMFTQKQDFSLWYNLYEERVKEFPMFDENDQKWNSILRFCSENSNERPVQQMQTLQFVEWVDNCIELTNGNKNERKHSKKLLRMILEKTYLSKPMTSIIKKWAEIYGGLDHWLETFLKIRTTDPELEDFLVTLDELSIKTNSNQKTKERIRAVAAKYALDLSVQQQKYPFNSVLIVNDLNVCLKLIPYLVIQNSFQVVGSMPKILKVFNHFNWDSQLVSKALETILLEDKKSSERILAFAYQMLLSSGKMTRIRVCVSKLIISISRLIGTSIGKSNRKSTILKLILHVKKKNKKQKNKQTNTV